MTSTIVVVGVFVVIIVVVNVYVIRQLLWDKKINKICSGVKELTISCDITDNVAGASGVLTSELRNNMIGRKCRDQDGKEWGEITNVYMDKGRCMMDVVVMESRKEEITKLISGVSVTMGVRQDGMESSGGI